MASCNIVVDLVDQDENATESGFLSPVHTLVHRLKPSTSKRPNCGRGNALEEFIYHVGSLMGRNLDKSEQLNKKVEVTEDSGKRVVKVTTMEWGYKLNAYICNPFFDSRLATSDYSIELEEVKTDADWQRFISSIPWSNSDHRKLTIRHLIAKLEAQTESLALEGARGMWELAVNKQHHGDHDSLASMKALIPHLSSANDEVVIAAAAAIWGLSFTKNQRYAAIATGAVPSLVALLHRSQGRTQQKDSPQGKSPAGAHISQTAGICTWRPCDSPD
eukprot:jgi/Botrbrau1/11706/Bobra.0195s0035.1